MPFFNLSSVIANDYQFFDGTSTVTLKDFEGDATTVAGVSSKPLTKKQTAQIMPALGLDDETQGFSLPVANIASVEPQNGFKVVDANGVIWNVLTAELLTLDNRWMLGCVRSRSEFTDLSLVLIYDGEGSPSVDGHFGWTSESPYNFEIKSTSAGYFLGKLNGDGIEANGTAITMTGNGGSISGRVHSVDDSLSSTGVYTLNTYIYDEIPWSDGTVTITID